MLHRHPLPGQPTRTSTALLVQEVSYLPGVRIELPPKQPVIEQHEVLDPLLAVLEGDGGAQEAHGAGGVEKGHDREALGVERSH